MIKLIKRKNSEGKVNSDLLFFEVNNWVISDFVLKKLVPVIGVRPFPLNELMLLTAAMVRFSPEYVIEWGTNIGKSARVFYEVNKYFSLRSKVYSIDLPENIEHNEHPHKDRGKLVRGKKEVELLLGDGLTKTKELMHQFGSNANVLFFLDGDHSYESVSRELKFITKNYKKAKILVHDTLFQDEKSGYNVGPYLAVKEILDLGKYNIIVENTGLPGMTLLWQK